MEYVNTAVQDTLGLPAIQKKIGLFGGTFNPVHCGHVEMARQVLEEFGLDEVWMLPSGHPPHKTHVASAQHRVAMLRLAVKGVRGLSVCELEVHRAGHTYTVDTLTELAERYPRVAFFYIVGADTLFELCTWKCAEQVMRMVTFLCVGRSGYSGLAAEAERLQQTCGARIELANCEGGNVSSTLVRMRVQKGMSIDGLVPPEIEEYIKAHGLYTGA